MNNALAGTVESCSLEETKQIYSSQLGTLGFQPGRGRKIADDLTTELVRDCSICSLRVRVTGGVEGGGGKFLADFALYDGCPAAGEGGIEIPGTILRFSDLEDDADQFHDLILDYSDRGICDDTQPCLVSQQNCTGGTCDDGSGCNTDGPDCGDGSECVSSGFVCVEDPLEIPATVWLRLRFDTDDAAVVMGSPPTRGFSADAYDDPQAFCTAWFAGWPTFPHATMFAEILAPATCETHFLAYLAANPNRPAFLPSDIGPIVIPGGGTRPPVTTPTTRLGDDIRLTVDHCILSAYELGMKGNIGEFTMEIDLRWPDINTIRTEATFHGRGEGSAEVGHFTIDENLNLSIGPNDQPIVMTWKSNKSNTGAMEVNITQAGTSLPIMFAFDVNPNTPDEWSIVPDGDFSPAVFYAAIFCRGDAPRGACCPNQAAIPGSDMNCFDDVPVTSCLGTRWQINSTCEQNFFNPPCGTHACCLPNGHCEDRTFDDCVEECITDVDPIFCEPVCNGGENDRQPCNPANGDADCAPDGICDPDASCPGQRTCGLTGCQLNGVFTDRPCELDSPDRGASDCMTCSGSGEYCRPRCVDGLSRGRPCDDHTDCPGGTCDNNVDCPVGHTCKSIQTCEHDANQCDLRCARWSAGEFCSQNGVEEDCLFLCIGGDPPNGQSPGARGGTGIGGPVILGGDDMTDHGFIEGNPGPWSGVTVAESEPNDDSANADAMAIGDDYVGDLSTGGPTDLQDFVGFAATGGETIVATTVLWTLGDSTLSLNLLDEAARQHRAAVDLVPGSPSLRLRSAETYLLAGRPREALQVLEDSLAFALDDTANGIFNNRAFTQGKAYRDLGQLEKAAQLLEVSLELGLTKDKTWDAHQTLREVYTALGRTDLAAQHSGVIVKIEPSEA
ncbi:MAG: tetratricopeptide repeat protein, partial [Planctomycetes bacterium]|nr:tetratricopeptide repeat protein [Planctomycetota bacterium]